MVAYSFNDRFVSLIYAGVKTQTVRRRGSKRHARVGEAVQIYTALRTRYARKILKTDPVCIGVDEIVIDIGTTPDTTAIVLNGRTLTGREFRTFCRDDGFVGPDDFWTWWHAAHGEGRLADCLVIRWQLQDDAK